TGEVDTPDRHPNPRTGLDRIHQGDEGRSARDVRRGPFRQARGVVAEDRGEGPDVHAVPVHQELAAPRRGRAWIWQPHEYLQEPSRPPAGSAIEATPPAPSGGSCPLPRPLLAEPPTGSPPPTTPAADGVRTTMRRPSGRRRRSTSPWTV